MHLRQMRARKRKDKNKERDKGRNERERNSKWPFPTTFEWCHFHRAIDPMSRLYPAVDILHYCIRTCIKICTAQVQPTQQYDQLHEVGSSHENSIRNMSIKLALANSHCTFYGQAKGTQKEQRWPSIDTFRVMYIPSLLICESSHHPHPM